MIIHSYLTDGYFGWGKLFLESFKYHNGTEYPIILDTRNLKSKQIDRLEKIYPNIQVKNKPLMFNEIAKKARVSLDKLLNHKDQVENLSVNKSSVVWKQYISVEDRYRNTIKEAMEENKDNDFLLHMDIDMYVRDNLEYLFDIIRNHDISIRFRLKKKNPNKIVNNNRKVLGNIIGFRICDEVYDFMNTWIKYIDKLPLHKKYKGYGQASFYFTYRDYKNSLNWGDIPFIAKSKGEKAILWTANKGANKSQLVKSEQDFKKVKNNGR